MFLNRHLQKQKILDDLIYPLKSYVINVLNYIKDYEQYNYFDIKKFVDDNSSLLFQLDENMIDFVYELVKLLEKRYDFFNVHTGVSNYLISKNFKSIVKSKDGTYERNKNMVIVRIEYVHIDTSIMNLDTLLHECLIRKLTPREYFNIRDDVREIREIYYFLPTVDADVNTISEKEFESIWEQIIIDAKNDVVYQNIWKYTDEIHSTCETILEYLNEYI